MGQAIGAIADNSFQVVSSIQNYLGKRKLAKMQRKLAGQIHPEDKSMGLLQQEFNGRMRGAADAERNIQTAQGNALSSIANNSTDSNQALALSMGTQGQADQANLGLAGMENDNHLGLLDRLDNKYDQQYVSDVNAKAALTNAAIANKVSGNSSAVNAGYGMGQAGVAAWQQWGSQRPPTAVAPPTNLMQGNTMGGGLSGAAGQNDMPAGWQSGTGGNYGMVGPQQLTNGMTVGGLSQIGMFNW